MSDSDEDLFLSEMAGVKPLAKPVARVQIKKRDKTDKSFKRKAAVDEVVADPNYLATDYVQMLDPFYISSFKRPGIQEGVFKKLRLGKYASEARLDLHRKKLEQARQEVFRFINDAQLAELRNLIIVHGKGLHDSESRSGTQQTKKTAILKSYVHHWLQQMPDVQAFHSAQAHHGGTGAVYVLLKKSENARLKNKEIFQNKNKG